MKGRAKKRKAICPAQMCLFGPPSGSGESLCFEVAHCVIDWVKFRPSEGERPVRTVCVIGEPLVS